MQSVNERDREGKKIARGAMGSCKRTSVDIKMEREREFKVE